jgi:hypothetical protein
MELILEEVRAYYDRTGTWTSQTKLNNILAKDGICRLPHIFQGVRPHDSLVSPRCIKIAQDVLDAKYKNLYGPKLDCLEGHYTTFYSGASHTSLLSYSSQMVNYNIMIDDLLYNSLEVYYQIRKHIAVKAIVEHQPEKFGNVQFLKVPKVLQPKECSNND